MKCTFFWFFFFSNLSSDAKDLISQLLKKVLFSNLRIYNNTMDTPLIVNTVSAKYF